MTERLGRVAPGLSALLHYRIAENLQYDFVAGLSVAAVALPVSVEYAELAVFNPVVGLLFKHIAPGGLRRIRHLAATDRESRRRNLRNDCCRRRVGRLRQR